MSAPEEPAAPLVEARHIFSAAAIYFVLVFAVGLVLGPPRVLWLEPVLGQAIAVLCEAPLLIIAMGFAARWAPRWAGIPHAGWRARLAIGVLALVFQQMADLSVGLGLRGLNFQQQLDYFATPAGWIYAATLIYFALAPLVSYWRARVRRTPPPLAQPGNDQRS